MLNTLIFSRKYLCNKKNMVAVMSLVVTTKMLVCVCSSLHKAYVRRHILCMSVSIWSRLNMSDVLKLPSETELSISFDDLFSILVTSRVQPVYFLMQREIFSDLL